MKYLVLQKKISFHRIIQHTGYEKNILELDLLLIVLMGILEAEIKKIKKNTLTI